ncbi:CU044_5270 family protein [Pengzhenrongella sicca]|uniref:CU044_5270 family protein n=1 Tax=Pengzhenrongella sicca TaxID=2819238 RepID=A0A8A4Z9L7_9MICO|nr:CU044_5270 family protein [Pengzhenrongella sicca]QTE28610.1 CU044_5270 family protein [Pengzhenrongella sicca]
MNNPTLDDRLTRIGPTGSPDPDGLADAYAQLCSRLECSDGVDAVRPAVVQPLRRRRARRISLTVLVGAAAAFAIVAIPVLGTGGGSPISTASAAELFIRAGQAAGEQPDVSRDAAYWHSVQISDVWSDASNRVESARRETWSGHQNWSVWTDTVLSPEPRLENRALFGPGITWDEMFALPTDPAALEDALRRYANPDDPKSVADGSVWGAVEDLLVNSPASPALRQALWQVAARLPDTSLGGDVTDSTGRPGIQVTRPYEELIVDPETGRLLERLWWDSTDNPPYRDTFLEQGPADTAPNAPDPDLPPGCTLDKHCDGGAAVDLLAEG